MSEMIYFVFEIVIGIGYLFENLKDIEIVKFFVDLFVVSYLLKILKVVEMVKFVYVILSIVIKNIKDVEIVKFFDKIFVSLLEKVRLQIFEVVIFIGILNINKEEKNVGIEYCYEDKVESVFLVNVYYIKEENDVNDMEEESDILV